MSDAQKCVLAWNHGVPDKPTAEFPNQFFDRQEVNESVSNDLSSSFLSLEKPEDTL